MIELDDAITRETEDERIDEIAGTLWRMLYLKREDIDPEEVRHVIMHFFCIKRES